MKTRSYLILLILWLFLLSGCFSSYETIRDIRELKQDHSFYLGRMTPDSLMLDPAEQRVSVTLVKCRPALGSTPQNTLAVPQRLYS